MSKLWISLKRDRIYADIFYNGQKICTIKVNETNRSNNAVIDLVADKDVTFKIVKPTTTTENETENENRYNKELYNR